MCLPYISQTQCRHHKKRPAFTWAAPTHFNTNDIASDFRTAVPLSMPSEKYRLQAPGDTNYATVRCTRVLTTHTQTHTHTQLIYLQRWFVEFIISESEIYWDERGAVDTPSQLPEQTSNIRAHRSRENQTHAHTHTIVLAMLPAAHSTWIVD